METVTGIVIDAESGMPIPGANVIQKGTSNGVITNFDGEFTIEVPEGVVLEISFIGYAMKEVEFTGQTFLEIVLNPETSILDEVVVTALGITRKQKSLTYATQTIKPEGLAEIRDPNNILNTFQGKVANAVITQSSGGVGSDARIVLRGNSSIDGNNSALIVVDGVPTSTASNINPDDIESVNVLPGASAAVLYGSQAGNGVIVITTKKGKVGEMSVHINSGLTIETPFALPEVQNLYGQGNQGELDASVGHSWGARMEGQEYINFLDEPDNYNAHPDNIRNFFNTGLNRHSSIGISGGSEKILTYLSYTNNEVMGIIPQNELMSHTINLRLSNQITDRFSIGAKITYFSQDIENIPRAGEGNNPVLDIYQIPRNISTEQAQEYQIMNDLGIPMPAPWPSPVPSIYGNPYWVINNDVHDEKENNIVALLSAKYQINNWLEVTGRANIDRSFKKAERKVLHGTLLWATRPGGYYSENNVTINQKWFDIIFNGHNPIGENFNVDYNIGAIYQDDQFSETSGVANGLNVTNKFSLNFATDPQLIQSGTRIQTQSVFGQANIAFRDQLYLNGSFRNDWDSRLPAPHAYQYYSIGSSVILSDLMAMPKEINFLKINASYAEVGNGGQFGLLSTTYNYSQGAGNGYLSRSPILPIPGLQPEIVKSREAGIEARFLNNRLGLRLTYYKSNSTNQLLTVTLPSGTGYSSQYINAGNIENKGVEIVANAVPVESENFEWNMDFNIAFNRNKVIELSEDLNVVYLGGHSDFGGRPQVKVGGNFGDLVSYQWQRDESQNFVVTPSGTPLTTLAAGEEPKVIGNFNPDATLGLTNSFSYKRFSLRALVDGRIGGEMISGTEQNLAFSGITVGTKEHREGGWNLGGVNAEGESVSETITAQEFWQTASGKRFGVGEFFAYDATSFRMREVAIGYNIQLSPDSFIESLDISLVGRNLFWIYRGKAILDIPGLDKRKMWFDPDISMGNGNNFQGVEYGALPSTSSYGLNLNFKF